MVRELKLDSKTVSDIEIALVIIVFGHAILTHTFIGVFLLLVATTTLLPALRRDD